MLESLTTVVMGEGGFGGYWNKTVKMKSWWCGSLMQHLSRDGLSARLSLWSIWVNFSKRIMGDYDDSDDWRR